MRAFALRTRQTLRLYVEYIFMALSFVLPIIIYMYATRAFTHNFYDGFTRGIKLEAERILELKQAINSEAPIDKLSVVREFLANYFDLFALMGLLPGAKIFELLYAGHIIKFGLAGASSYYLFRRTVGADRYGALPLSLSYALFSVELTYGQLVSVQNMALLLPLVIVYIDKYYKKPEINSFLRLSIVLTLLFISGAPGLITGLPFVILVGIVIALCRFRGFINLLSNIGGTIISLLISLLLSAVITIPRFYYAPVAEHTDVKGVNYKAFDFITSFIDGKAINAVSGDVIANTLGVFALLLIVLAFINPLIPYRLKIAVFVMTVLYHLCSSFKLWDSYIDIFGGELFAGSRILAMNLILLFYAAVSYKNIKALNRNNFYLAIFIILGIVVLANNSALEFSPSVFALYFTAGAAIVFGSLFISDDITKRTGIICVLALIELVINLYQVAPKSVIGINELQNYDCGSTVDTDMLSVNGDVDFPLWDKNGKEYMVLSSDMSEYKAYSIPEAMNAALEAALLPTVFENYQFDMTFSTGFTDSGNNLYWINNPGIQSVMNIVLTIEEGQEYYLTSSNNSIVYITESTIDADEVYVYNSNVMHKIVATEGNVSIRFATTSTQAEYISINVWKTSKDKLESVRNILGNFNGSTINDKVEKGVLSLPGSKTVITSIPYTTNLVAKVSGHKVPVFDYQGLLAISVTPDDGCLPVISIGYNAVDYTVGIIISSLGLAIIAIMLYINKVIIIKENSGVIHEDK